MTDRQINEKIIILLKEAEQLITEQIQNINEKQRIETHKSCLTQIKDISQMITFDKYMNVNLYNSINQMASGANEINPNTTSTVQLYIPNTQQTVDIPSEQFSIIYGICCAVFEAGLKSYEIYDPNQPHKYFIELISENMSITEYARVVDSIKKAMIEILSSNEYPIVEKDIHEVWNSQSKFTELIATTHLAINHESRMAFVALLHNKITPDISGYMTLSNMMPINTNKIYNPTLNIYDENNIQINPVKLIGALKSFRGLSNNLSPITIINNGQLTINIDNVNITNVSLDPYDIFINHIKLSKPDWYKENKAVSKLLIYDKFVELTNSNIINIIFWKVMKDKITISMKDTRININGKYIRAVTLKKICDIN